MWLRGPPGPAPGPCACPDSGHRCPVPTGPALPGRPGATAGGCSGWFIVPALGGPSQGFGTEAAPARRLEPRPQRHSGRLGACRATRHLLGAAVLRPPAQVPQTTPEYGPPAVGEGGRPGRAGSRRGLGVPGTRGPPVPERQVGAGGGGCGFLPLQGLSSPRAKAKVWALVLETRGGGGGAGVCLLLSGPQERCPRGWGQLEAWSRAPSRAGPASPQDQRRRVSPRVQASAGSGFFGFI